ncbi:hypothetical protein EON67_07405 [archaeon]|nr:MAG: hypothetical protein EON67_07405 [archaeon]
MQKLEGHTDEIFSCAFNYEGDAIITGSKDNTCRYVTTPLRAHCARYARPCCSGVHMRVCARAVAVAVQNLEVLM